MVYFLFFLLGLFSCVVLASILWWIRTKQLKDRLRIADDLIEQYRIRKRFYKEKSIELIDEMTLKNRTIRTLESQNDKLRTEKLRAWDIPDKL